MQITEVEPTIGFKLALTLKNENIIIVSKNAHYIINDRDKVVLPIINNPDSNIKFIAYAPLQSTVQTILRDYFSINAFVVPSGDGSYIPVIDSNELTTECNKWFEKWETALEYTLLLTIQSLQDQ